MSSLDQSEQLANQPQALLYVDLDQHVRAAREQDFDADEARALFVLLDQWIHYEVTGEIEDTISKEYIDNGEHQPTIVHTHQQAWGQCDAQEVAAAGLSLEVAGPTMRRPGRNILPDAQVALVSNLINNKVLSHAKAHLDLRADGTCLPFVGESFGSVHAAYLPGVMRHALDGYEHLRSGVISEAVRVLRPGGFLVWDGGSVDDYQQILACGLRPRKLITQSSVHERFIDDTRSLYEGIAFSVHGVYQK